MSSPSSDLEVKVGVRDYPHFEQMNDYICFNRHMVRSYQWDHHAGGPPYWSQLTISFHHLTDALVFKLTHG
jgi:hypothetical protein